ncbi:MAG: septum formation initiator family protein [Anaerolineae bacterium]|nr:septum formation initiator family protein [Anaerolineae bacterium]
MSPVRSKPGKLAVVFTIGVILILTGSLVWGFAQQVMRARKILAEEARLEQKVAAAQARHDALVKQLEYIRSDEYVERWARTEAKLARAGEVVVIVVEED